MNIHLPPILMFARATWFWPIPIYIYNNLLYMFPVWLIKKPCCWSKFQAAEKAEKAAEAARTAWGTAGFDGGPPWFGRGGRMEEPGGKMWKKDGKSWKKMGKWTDMDWCFESETWWFSRQKRFCFHVFLDANYRTNKVNKPTWPILDLF